MLEPELNESWTAVSNRQLREFAAMWLVFFCAIGAWQWFANANAPASMALCALGLLVGLSGFARPSLVKPLFSLAMTLAIPIGWIMTRLLLGFLFFFLFTPVGWLFRRLQRDLLHLKKRRSTSYWSPARQSSDPRSYFRQSL